MEKNTLRVGMRNVKTALAIFVCLLLYQFVPGNASYACIAALIAMQSTLEESWSQGRNRLLGTFIGGIFGAAFASLQIAARLPFWRIVAISAGVTVLIFLLNLIGKRGAIVMGCVTYLVIVLSPAEGSVWLYSLWRAVDNAIGILVAIGINLSIRPPKNPDSSESDETAQEPPETPDADSRESDPKA